MSYTINLDHIAFHPGETLEEKLQEMGMTVEEFAEKAHVSVEYAKGVISCETAVTPETAVAFEMVTMIPARLWLKMQHDYDDYLLMQKKPSWIDRFTQFTLQKAAIL